MVQFCRIGVVRPFCLPVHVAYRGPRYCARQHHAGRKLCRGRKKKLPDADQNSSDGHPTVKQTADFALMRKVGRLVFVIHNLPRCRGPPQSENSKIQIETEEYSCNSEMMGRGK